MAGSSPSATVGFVRDMADGRGHDWVYCLTQRPKHRGREKKVPRTRGDCEPT